MSPKLTTFFFMAALILFSSSISHIALARPEPGFHVLDSRHKGVHADHEKPSMEFDESCDGIGDDECLMRRTLAAHTDYLYTQNQKP